MNPFMTARVCCTNMLGTRAQSLGYVGVWAACSVVYACAAIAFTGAPPSPQPPPKARALPPAPPPAARHCHHRRHNSAFISATHNLQAQPSWLSSSTPALLCRLLAQRSLRPLCVAFLLAGAGARRRTDDHLGNLSANYHRRTAAQVSMVASSVSCSTRSTRSAGARYTADNIRRIIAERAQRRLHQRLSWSGY